MLDDLVGRDVAGCDRRLGPREVRPRDRPARHVPTIASSIATTKLRITASRSRRHDVE